MSKWLENSVFDNAEYLMLAVTFVGVLYLVLKDLNVSVSAGRDGYSSGAGLRHAVVSTSPTNATSPLEGFSMNKGGPEFAEPVGLYTQVGNLGAYANAVHDSDYTTVGNSAMISELGSSQQRGSADGNPHRSDVNWGDLTTEGMRRNPFPYEGMSSRQLATALHGM